jgi:hypothetical protein
VSQNQLVNFRHDIQQSSDIAEAGLNYYRWFLAHYPDDLTNGTGLPGPYIKQYFDPEGAAIGEYSLDITSTAYCGDVAAVNITSVGTLYKNPSARRTISARYARPTVAEYSYIINSNVWAGPDRTIVGPYHSNGGVRMDGTNLSVVSSGQTTWSCSSSFGCTTTVNRPGVFTTANGNDTLFAFPSAPITEPFSGLPAILAAMRDKALNGGGIFIPRSPGGLGYSVEFISGNRVRYSRVTAVTTYWGNPSGATTDWAQEQNVFTSANNTVTRDIDPACPLIFVEDKIWLEGQVNQKVTIAAASTTNSVLNPSIILQDNITYSTSTAGLLAVAEQDVLIGVDVPNDMTLNGIFVAQNGRYGRNYYCGTTTQSNCNSTRQLPVALRAFNFRNSETLNGTVVSNGRVGTQWTSAGISTSGFLIRTNTYDRNLVDDPPPLIPKASNVYILTNWREEG